MSSKYHLYLVSRLIQFKSTHSTKMIQVSAKIKCSLELINICPVVDKELNSSYSVLTIRLLFVQLDR